eukprot:CAMPEP_0195578686 /NCGR_PEP_ID=MMETSP0814-20130614/12445_1 /TAXON_ID=97485 /ORGANISM="Prymnesium parvum, Strain Texoma1" /LENGTH=68 /DNA_ID=CAMNT_0040715249 /DNA_START=355 /DNA_END=558 /DNA_ORIENTATION=-
MTTFLDPNHVPELGWDSTQVLMAFRVLHVDHVAPGHPQDDDDLLRRRRLWQILQHIVDALATPHRPLV